MAIDPAPRSYSLQDPAVFEALASPHRLEIVSALGEMGKASIAMLARRLGRTPHSLYYHVRLLERAGVLVPIEVRRRGRRDEQLWTVIGDRILVGATPGAPRSAAAAARALNAVLRLTSREVREALTREEFGRARAARQLVGMRMKVRLDGRTLAQVNERIDQIEKIVRRANRKSAKGRMYSITLVLTPTADKSPEETTDADR